MQEIEKFKINRFHYQEILFILMILSTDLSDYDREELTNLVEDIEGRPDCLFTPEYLQSLAPQYVFDGEMIAALDQLRLKVMGMYKSQWSLDLRDELKSPVGLRKAAQSILNMLGVEYVEPNKFAEENMNVDW